MAEVRSIPAWYRMVLRQLELRPESEALKLCGVGQSTFNYAVDTDEQFAEDVKAARQKRAEGIR